MRFVRCVFPLVLAQSLIAQQPRQPRQWEYIVIPALNFNSDEGFGYGVVVDAQNYAGNVKPYRMAIQPAVLLTTRGRRDITVFFDAPGLLPEGWRLDAFAGREQELATPYYGIGNDAAFDTMLSRDPNPYFYRYGRTRFRVLANVQRRLGATHARVLLGAGFAHVTTDAIPFDSGTTLFAQDFGAAGAPKGRIASVRTGLLWDTRDREIGSRSGWFNEVLVQRVDRALGASQSYTRATFTARRYVPLSSRVSTASRLVLQQTSDGVPVYDIATVQSSYKQEEGLGGSKMLRGVPKNRVVGRGLALLNNEVRWRVTDFSLRRKPAFLMLSAFGDVGRVWAESIKFDEIASDLWSGVGGGVRLGLGQSSVVALDVGRSASATQLYIGLGYAY
jgi:outer membrane protein assembly factor BamA